MSMNQTLDAIGLVETAYDLSLDTKGWIAAMAEKVRPTIGGEYGMISCLYEYRSTGRIDIKEVVATEVSPWRRELMLAGTKRIPAALGRKMFVGGDALTTPIESFGSALDSLYKRLPEGFRRAAPNAIVFKAFDPSGAGIVFSSGHKNSQKLRTNDKERLACIAAHICAGLRLRRAATTIDAVFDPQADKIVHLEACAEGAQEQLRAAAKCVDRARTRSTGDDEALQMWEGLVDGSWSLVESFESDGRRLIVAKKNSETTRDPRQLSHRQRQVAALAAMGHNDKLIAYSLGISTSAVRSHLTRAMRKLGIENQRNLLRFMRFDAESKSRKPVKDSSDWLS